MRSVVVVLPASMWAMIPMFRVFSSVNLRGMEISLLCLRSSCVGCPDSGQRNGPLGARVVHMLRGGPIRSGLMSRVTPCEGPRLRVARRNAAATAVEYSRGMTLWRRALNAAILLVLTSTATPAEAGVRALAPGGAAGPALVGDRVFWGEARRIISAPAAGGPAVSM